MNIRKIFTVLIILLTICFDIKAKVDSLLIEGQVLFSLDSMPEIGLDIYQGNNSMAKTDSLGKFKLTVNANENLNLVFKYENEVAIVLENIPINDESINLGVIFTTIFVLNATVSDYFCGENEKFCKLKARFYRFKHSIKDKFSNRKDIREIEDTYRYYFDGNCFKIKYKTRTINLSKPQKICTHYNSRYTQLPG